MKALDGKKESAGCATFFGPNIDPKMRSRIESHFHSFWSLLVLRFGGPEFLVLLCFFFSSGMADHASRSL